MTPEGAVKRDVKKYLTSIGAYFFMPVQMGYGKRTIDILCCIKGRFVGIELKRPGGLPTKKQSDVIDEIYLAGGIAFYADSVERVKKYIEDHVLEKYEPEV